METKENKVIVPHWRLVFFTWSFWLHSVSVVLTFFEQVLPFFSVLQPALSDKEYAFGMFFLNIAALLAKFIRQKNLEARKAVIEDNDNANNKLD